jgi:hypothetical protein
MESRARSFQARSGDGMEMMQRVGLGAALRYEPIAYIQTGSNLGSPTLQKVCIREEISIDQARDCSAKAH